MKRTIDTLFSWSWSTSKKGLCFIRCLFIYMYTFFTFILFMLLFSMSFLYRVSQKKRKPIQNMPNIQFLSILLNEKYMAFYMWLFAIYWPNFVIKYVFVFKIMPILGMRPKSHSNMISIFSSCDARSILATVTAYLFGFLSTNSNINTRACTYVIFAYFCQISLKCKH